MTFEINKRSILEEADKIFVPNRISKSDTTKGGILAGTVMGTVGGGLSAGAAHVISSLAGSDESTVHHALVAAGITGGALSAALGYYSAHKLAHDHNDIRKNIRRVNIMREMTPDQKHNHDMKVKNRPNSNLYKFGVKAGDAAKKQNFSTNEAKITPKKLK